MAKCCCQLQFDKHSIRGTVWQLEVSKLHKLHVITMAAMWRPESLCHIPRTAANYMKFCYLLSEWNSRAKKSNYKKRDWPSWQSLEVGTKNAQHLLLVECSNILLPSVHIKLGLIKNFVKVMDQRGSTIRYLTEKFPRVSAAKTKEGRLYINYQLDALTIIYS